MGTNSKTTHLAYTTAPTAGDPGPDPGPGGEMSDAEAAQKLQELFHAFLEQAHNRLDEPDFDGVNLSELYDGFASDIHQAAAFLAEAEKLGLSPEEVAFGQAQIKETVAQLFDGLDKDELAQIAADHGFEHPHLVGMNGEKGPLEAWLNPAYPDDAAYKAKIQAKALERYDALAAGQTINGMTLADYQAMFGSSAPSPPPDGSWQATPAEVLAAQTAALTAIGQWAKVQDGKAYTPTEEKTAALAALIAAENHLADASCPELGEGLDVAKAALRHQVDQALWHPAASGVQVVNAAHAAGDLTDNQAALLTMEDQLSLLRHNVDPDQRAALAAKAESRAADAAALMAAVKAFEPFTDTSKPWTVLKMPADASAQTVAEMATASGAAQKAFADVKAWQPSHIDSFALLKNIDGYTNALVGSPQDLTAGFRAWAKTRAMTDLRADAQALGLGEEGLKSASRAQLQNYIASHWDPTLNKSAIASAVAAAPAAKASAAAAAAAASSAAAASTAATAPAPSTGPATAPAATGASAKPAVSVPGAATVASAAKAPVSGFSAKQQELISALSAAGAAHGGIPKPLDAAAVAAHDFGAGTSASLGGSHQMSVHTGPDGTPWLFKPDHAMGGAKAQAEAAGAAAFAKAGLPAVPVYTAKVGGVLGAVQPKLTGATPFSSNPSSWSQADVDTLVRHQVAAWVTGDHDGHPANLLRTSTGGLVPVDHGTAFKHYGGDQLSLSYTPSTTTAFQLACHAHQSGSLASGVKINPMAAHPVIKAFEQMPDAEWRAGLHAVAHEGVASGSATWIPAMRKKAAKTHGVAAKHVSDAQIAEAFLDHAVERKASLRSTFASFFTDQLGAATGALLKYGS